MKASSKTMFDIGDLVRVKNAMPRRKHLAAVIVDLGALPGSRLISFAECKFTDGSKLFVKLNQLEHVEDVEKVSPR